MADPVAFLLRARRRGECQSFRWHQLRRSPSMRCANPTRMSLESLQSSKDVVEVVHGLHVCAASRAIQSRQAWQLVLSNLLDITLGAGTESSDWPEDEAAISSQEDEEEGDICTEDEHDVVSSYEAQTANNQQSWNVAATTATEQQDSSVLSLCNKSLRQRSTARFEFAQSRGFEAFCSLLWLPDSVWLGDYGTDGGAALLRNELLQSIREFVVTGPEFAIAALSCPGLLCRCSELLRIPVNFGFAEALIEDILALGDVNTDLGLLPGFIPLLTSLEPRLLSLLCRLLSIAVYDASLSFTDFQFTQALLRLRRVPRGMAIGVCGPRLPMPMAMLPPQRRAFTGTGNNLQMSLAPSSPGRLVRVASRMRVLRSQTTRWKRAIADPFWWRARHKAGKRFKDQSVKTAASCNCDDESRNCYIPGALHSCKKFAEKNHLTLLRIPGLLERLVCLLRVQSVPLPVELAGLSCGHIPANIAVDPRWTELVNVQLLRVTHLPGSTRQVLNMWESTVADGQRRLAAFQNLSRPTPGNIASSAASGVNSISHLQRKRAKILRQQAYLSTTTVEALESLGAAAAEGVVQRQWMHRTGSLSLSAVRQLRHHLQAFDDGSTAILVESDDRLFQWVRPNEVEPLSMTHLQDQIFVSDRRDRLVEFYQLVKVLMGAAVKSQSQQPIEIHGSHLFHVGFRQLTNDFLTAHSQATLQKKGRMDELAAFRRFMDVILTPVFRKDNSKHFDTATSADECATGESQTCCSTCCVENEETALVLETPPKAPKSLALEAVGMAVGGVAAQFADTMRLCTDWTILLRGAGVPRQELRDLESLMKMQLDTGSTPSAATTQDGESSEDDLDDRQHHAVASTDDDEEDEDEDDEEEGANAVEWFEADEEHSANGMAQPLVQVLTGYEITPNVATYFLEAAELAGQQSELFFIIVSLLESKLGLAVRERLYKLGFLQLMSDLLETMSWFEHPVEQPVVPWVIQQFPQEDSAEKLWQAALKGKITSPAAMLWSKPWLPSQPLDILQCLYHSLAINAAGPAQCIAAIRTVATAAAVAGDSTLSLIKKTEQAVVSREKQAAQALRDEECYSSTTLRLLALLTRFFRVDSTEDDDEEEDLPSTEASTIAAASGTPATEPTGRSVHLPIMCERTVMNSARELIRLACVFCDFESPTLSLAVKRQLLTPTEWRALHTAGCPAHDLLAPPLLHRERIQVCAQHLNDSGLQQKTRWVRRFVFSPTAGILTRLIVLFAEEGSAESAYKSSLASCIQTMFHGSDPWVQMHACDVGLLSVALRDGLNHIARTFDVLGDMLRYNGAVAGRLNATLLLHPHITQNLSEELVSDFVGCNVFFRCLLLTVEFLRQTAEANAAAAKLNKNASAPTVSWLALHWFTHMAHHDMAISQYTSLKRQKENLQRIIRVPGSPFRRMYKTSSGPGPPEWWWPIPGTSLPFARERFSLSRLAKLYYSEHLYNPERRELKKGLFSSRGMRVIPEEAQIRRVIETTEELRKHPQKRFLAATGSTECLVTTGREAVQPILWPTIKREEFVTAIGVEAQKAEKRAIAGKSTKLRRIRKQHRKVDSRKIRPPPLSKVPIWKSPLESLMESTRFNVMRLACCLPAGKLNAHTLCCVDTTLLYLLIELLDGRLALTLLALKWQFMHEEMRFKKLLAHYTKRLQLARKEEEKMQRQQQEAIKEERDEETKTVEPGGVENRNDQEEAEESYDIIADVLDGYYDLPEEVEKQCPNVAAPNFEQELKSPSTVSRRRVAEAVAVEHPQLAHLVPLFVTRDLESQKTRLPRAMLNLLYLLHFWHAHVTTQHRFARELEFSCQIPGVHIREVSGTGDYCCSL